MDIVSILVAVFFVVLVIIGISIMLRGTQDLTGLGPIGAGIVLLIVARLFGWI